MFEKIKRNIYLFWEFLKGDNSFKTYCDYSNVFIEPNWSSAQFKINTFWQLSKLIHLKKKKFEFNFLDEMPFSLKKKILNKKIVWDKNQREHFYKEMKETKITKNTKIDIINFFIEIDNLIDINGNYISYPSIILFKYKNKIRKGILKDYNFVNKTLIIDTKSFLGVFELKPIECAVI